MFDRQTVFILGAGASWHYGYPTGESLIQKVITAAQTIVNHIRCGDRNDDGWGRRRMRYGELLDSMYIKSKNLNSQDDKVRAYDKIEDNCELLIKRLKETNTLVIDYFLDHHEGLQEIGKILIAWVILECEKEYGSRAVHGGNNNKNQMDQISGNKRHQCKDDWYRFVIYKLLEGCKSPEDFLKNNINFVTFNYDLSLERTLWEALKSIDLFNNKNILESFLNAPSRFIHVYGKINSPPNVIPFKNKDMTASTKIAAQLDEAFEASKGIHTIGSFKDENTAELEYAKDLIDKAEDVYILGYGFDQENSKRLGLNDSLNVYKLEKNKKSKKVFFTNYDDLQRINKRASKIFFSKSNHFHPADGNIIDSNSLFFKTRAIYQDIVYEKSIRNVYEAFEKDFDF
jgi:hypothetical protein